MQKLLFKISFSGTQSAEEDNVNSPTLVDFPSAVDHISSHPSVAVAIAVVGVSISVLLAAVFFLIKYKFNIKYCISEIYDSTYSCLNNRMFYAVTGGILCILDCLWLYIRILRIRDAKLFQEVQYYLYQECH